MNLHSHSQPALWDENGGINLFLRNFYRSFGASMGASHKNINISTSGATVKTIQFSPDDLVFSADGAGYPTLKKVRDSYSGNGGIVFGNGDAAPTIDDFALSGDVIPINTYSVSLTHTVANDKTTISAVYTITNTGENAMTIKEIALKYGGSSTSQYLIERTVLNTPVTIEPGGVGQVTYTLTLTYPSKCTRLHGHNAIITVYCRSRQLDENGMVVDFSLIKERVEKAFDHQYLNDLVPFNPTAENMAHHICTLIPNCYKVEFQESEGNIAVYEIEEEP